MKLQFKTKDILLLALLTAIYFLLYYVTMMIIIPLGPFGHAISPGLCALLSGTVIYFTSRKIGKPGQYTIMVLLLMGLFSLMGGGYLPWLISSTIMAVLADLIASGSKTVHVLRVAVASALIHVGQAWGAIIPSWFFLEKYREDWIQRGQLASDMDAMIQYTVGLWGVYSTLIVAVLSIIGVYIGYLILRKHFKEN